ncbi:DUF2235 domain-containing protein [Amycolatopsis sp. NBC_01307]|uniref:DUF2235 domain-containing protein n=1 Tax=Amycolatopsis sp. NBC_01307 TaxID=2903561 RepID=UPI002E1315AB|nr:DUF2235 domain-containing protein [Amycolatopsis sp. NBC_01307]
MKRLVICCDGTWNTPDQTSGGTPSPTNVTKLALAVAGEFDGVPQRLYYHRGVGSYGRARLRGGAFGVGVAHDVLRAYRFVVENYEPDDEIFLFGFSRGAYTARSVAGLIRNAGVLKPAAVERLDDAYALYRARSIKPRDIESELFRRSYSHEDTRIRFIGVWDTVGALGIPTIGPKFLMDRINRRFAFHDTELSSRVDVAMHAVAIDERRKAFRPALWTRHDDAGDQVVEQVWFSGVHSDVGGGYPDSSLADIALRWLAGRAAEHGLGLRNGAFTTEAGWGVENLPAVHANPLGEIHESRKGIYRLQRPLARLRLDLREAVAMSVASSAVRRRHDAGAAYCPPGFDELAKAVPETDVG